MKKILLFLLLSSSLNSAEIGWKGDTWIAGSVVQNKAISVQVTSDNTVIDPSGVAIINLDSNNANATSRTVIIGAGKEIAQRVRVTCRPVNGNSQIEDNDSIPGSGNIRLANNWVCNQDGNSLTLFWNGTDWEEDGRVIL